MATIDRRGATLSAADPPIATSPNPDLAIKAPVRVATTGSNIVLSGLQTIDGVSLNAGDRVLVKDQTDATTNGIYNASTGSWTRTVDAKDNSQFAQGLQVVVAQGTSWTNTLFGLLTTSPITLGTSALTFLSTNVPAARNILTAAPLAGGGQLVSDITLSLTIGATLGVVGSVLRTLAATGDVTWSANSFFTTIAANAVSNAKFRQSVGLSLVGVTGSATANVADITGTANQIPIVNNAGTALAFATVSGDLTNATGAFTIANNAVTNAKAAQMAANTIKGNNTGGTANALDLSPGQVLAMLGLQAAPGGRLTVQSGVPVMTAAQANKTTLFYAPIQGGAPFVPIYNGTDVHGYQFTSSATDATGLSLSLGSNWGANTVYDVFATINGGVPVLATVAWTNSTTRATSLQLYSGMLTNGASATARISNTATITMPQNQGTYLGTFVTDASSAGQITWTPGAAGTGGTQTARLSIWNNYNRVMTKAAVTETTASWTYSTATVRAVNGASSNRVDFISGIADDAFQASYFSVFSTPATAGASAETGVALDATNTMDHFYFGQVAAARVTTYGGAVPAVYAPQVGFHSVNAVENGDGSNTATFLGGTNANGAPDMLLEFCMLM